jgi:diadenosine tetraphosphate (Ap4A) HIT family hydrolase
MTDQPNKTAIKFGYPDNLIAEYEHWLVLLRPAQATLGALVCVAKDKADAFSDLSPASFQELASVTADVEHALAQFTQYERINWLMLMMVDRDVHFHVLPRYSTSRSFAGLDFPDPAWPGPPDLAKAIKPEPEMMQTISQAIRALWPTRNN